MPKISIIVPVHNTQVYLRECLDSAVGQSLEDIEVICVDDHSEDTSADILRDYADNDPRVRVITYSANKSASQARKDGVLAANGEYIMFLDADDALDPQACEQLYTSMRSDPVDILHFGTAITNETHLPDERVAWVRRFLEPYDGSLTGREIFEGGFSEDSLYNFTLWDKLYSADLCKRSFLRIQDGPFPKAQDKYAYFVLSYFARTYRGIPGEVYYTYHYGRGVTGHNLLPMSEFERYCSMALVTDAIRDFLAEEDVLSRYEDLYAGVRDRLLTDCLTNWNEHLASDDRAAGFDLMLKYWEASEVVAKIAKLNWAQQGHIARLLKGSASIARKPRTVRVIGTFYYTISNGGTQRILSVLIKLWVSLGYKVVLFTDVPASDDDYDLPEGVQRVVLPASSEVKPGDYLDRARDIERAIRDYGIDVMVYHAWVSKILLWDLLACKTAGAAFVTHCHSSFSQPARSGRTYFADMPAVFHVSDAVIALSEVDRAYWSTFNDVVVSVVNPLTFDLNDLEVSSLEAKNVLWLGRMSAEKRPHDALRIFAKVLEEEPDAMLHMVGSCPKPAYMDGVRELVSKLGIQDSVVLHGFHKHVLPFYGMASVLLMTSEFEGFPLVLSESQSAGVPCVMYDLPYLTLTRSRKGFIAVELGDLNAAADGVVALLRDPEHRRLLGREARDNIESLAKFDFAGAWSEVFNGLSHATTQRPVDEATRIMWDTLLDHYRLGAVPRNYEINRLSREITAARRAGKKRAGARTELQRIRASWSFKIGHAITWVPRRIRKLLVRR